MIKALFLDMDDTLIDTIGANQKAKALMQEHTKTLFGDQLLDSQAFADGYVAGIYREWTREQTIRYQPIVDQQNEGAFRLQLIRDLLADSNVHNASDDSINILQEQFDRDRLTALDFFPGIADFLVEIRKQLTLIVITNGPEFSQIPKIQAIKLEDYVDHIIIGGQEPEQKPAPSIFKKALKLAQCEANEVIHIGDSLTTDIAGAQNSGITALWIQHQQPLDNPKATPEHRVKQASDFPTHIKKLLSD